jgi:hypothetical protein
MKLRRNSFSVVASLMAVSLAACSALQPTARLTQAAPTDQVQPSTGIQYHLVTNQLMLPTTKDQSEAYALNVDVDSQQTGDNLFGQLLALLTSVAPSLELQATLDQAVDAGQLVTLHLVTADDPLNDPSVSWSILLGETATSAPGFDGTDTFAIDSAAPANAPIVGNLADGHFSGGPGAARLRFVLLGQQVDVSVIGLRLEADLSAAGCANGRLGGGLTVDDFRGKLLPTLTDGLNLAVQSNSALANLLLPTLDADGDGTIAVQELENNPMLRIAAQPDLDLLDASGSFNPGQDGTNDSYSMGLGFTCVPATFMAPGE